MDKSYKLNMTEILLIDKCQPANKALHKHINKKKCLVEISKHHFQAFFNAAGMINV